MKSFARLPAIGKAVILGGGIALILLCYLGGLVILSLLNRPSAVTSVVTSV